MARGARALMPEVRALHAAATEAHPGVSLSERAFRAFVLPLIEQDPALAARHADDLFLACAAATGDARAIQIIDQRCLSDIAALLPRRKPAPSEADEIAQRARERLFVAAGGAPPKIAEYRGKGPLGAWIRVVVARVDATLRRRDRALDPLDAATEAQLTAASPEHLLAQARWQRAFDEALREAFAELPRDDRALFRLQFGKGLTLDQMAQLLAVHRATAARRIAAARERLWTALSASLRARLGIPAHELERQLGEWRSRLDVSLSGLLRDSAP